MLNLFLFHYILSERNNIRDDIDDLSKAGQVPIEEMPMFRVHYAQSICCKMPIQISTLAHSLQHCTSNRSLNIESGIKKKTEDVHSCSWERSKCTQTKGAGNFGNYIFLQNFLILIHIQSNSFRAFFVLFISLMSVDV